MIKWGLTTKEEVKKIHKIAKRASKMIPEIDLMTVSMDIEAVHTHGCKLRLDDLFTADDFNFIHDVLGINRHLNRNSGKLQNHFLPRYAE